MKTLTLARNQQATVRQTSAFEVKLIVTDGINSASVVMSPQDARELMHLLADAAINADFESMNMKITAWKASITANTNN